MFEHIKESIFNMITSRLIVLMILFVGLGLLFVYRIFNLQIVEGENYLNNFQLKTTKERSIDSSRGCIYDRNGSLLAYNELAYSINIEDVYESGRTKNAKLNQTIYTLIKMIESNHDKLNSDFHIIVNEDGNYQFTVEDAQLLRFLADVYGYSNANDMEYKYKTKTAAEVINDLCATSRYGIGNYTDENDSSSFVPGMGYTKDEVLKIVTVRYAMNANSFQKYIATTVATNVSDKTVAMVMENSDILEGVSVSEDTIRKYVDSVYFSQIIGYTGKVSPEELSTLQEENPDYDINDIVGKLGIEYSMETTLQGTKGHETVYVDNLGKVIETSDRVEPLAGNDVYLTIDKELQEAAYHIIEKKLASILLTKIQNIKEYEAGEHASSSDIIIPIYDVYFALFNNNIIDTAHFTSSTAGESEIEASEIFATGKEHVLEELNEEFYNKKTVYENLSTEYQVYESFITSMLYSDGILNTGLIDKQDQTYIDWTTNEIISLYDYLNYAIAMNWIDVDKLQLKNQYSDSGEIYDKLIFYINDRLKNNKEFDKKIYRYLIKNDRLSGRTICKILLEQKIVDIDDEEENRFLSGLETPYAFLTSLIENLELTPAQLALDPHSGSMVITDVNSGDVLALVSYPSYDNNRMANGVDAEYFAQLLNDLSTPMINYATQQKTAPGSTFKMVSATAGLMEGVIDPGTNIECRGIFENITPPPTCWIYGRGAHGNLNVTGGIQHSCNVFFYEVGYRLGLVGMEYEPDVGLTKLAKYASYYGLDETSGIEIEEAVPQLSDTDAVRSAIGQGTNNFTTVGLARYVTCVANNGTCYNLTLVSKITDRSGNILIDNKADVRNTIDMNTSYWNAIHAGMRRVVESKKYYENFGVTVAGKTGTAQESKSRPNHALFVCYAPYENPEIAIATRIANGYTSDYAAQVTKDVLEYYFKLKDTDELLEKSAGTMEGGAINAD